MAKWKSDVLNWAEEHSDGQIELKGWRAVFRDYLEKYDDDEEGFKQFLTEDESFEIMAEDYMEATGNSLYDRDGNLISDVILDYWKAHICPVCNKKISIFEEEYSRSKFLHRDCVKEFESQPGKYLEETKSDKSEPSDKDFITTLLICIFLGGLGGHRFFVGKQETAIAMLVIPIVAALFFVFLAFNLGILLFAGWGVWYLIDLLQIVTSSFEDNEGRVIAYQAAGTANTAPSTHVPEKVAEAPPAKDIPAQIEKLADLKDKGIITDEEFQQKKQELLDRI